MGLQTIFLDRSEIGVNIFPRHFRLQHVCRTGKVAGRPQDIDGPLHGAIDLVGRSERHGGLGADAAPKNQPIPELLLDLREVKALRPHGVEHRDADPDNQSSVE